MTNSVLFKDVIKIVNRWFENNKYVFAKYNIELDVRECEASGHYTIFGPIGDYCGQLMCEEPTFAPYRYIMFDVLEISTKKMIYYWYDNDVALEDIEAHLDNCMNVFIDLVKSS